MNTALKQAITRAGSARELARLLGISHQALSKWEKVPSHHLLEIERLTGVPREALRPDLYRETGC